MFGDSDSGDELPESYSMELDYEDDDDDENLPTTITPKAAVGVRPAEDESEDEGDWPVAQEH